VFSEVAFVDQLNSGADLIIEFVPHPRTLPARQSSWCETDPEDDYASLVTLGIFPICRLWNEGFWLRVRAAREKAVTDELGFSYEIYEIFGWIALPWNLLPGWLLIPPNERYQSHLKYFLLSHREEFLALAAKSE
jgi:hypothetical protein